MKRFFVLCFVVLVGLFIVAASSGDGKVQDINYSPVKVKMSNDLSSTTAQADPVLWVSKPLLNFAVNSDGYITGPQRFLIRNIGGGTLNWEVTDNSAWIACSPTSGSNFGVVDVSVDDLDGLKVGANNAKITVSDPNSANSPQTVYVTIWLYTSGPHPESDKPFGYFDTPGDNTIVSGSVPFTGWTLDDVEVEGVKIYRDDNIYVGDAVFVEGARPDVAQVYPDYPFFCRAGWGYMMLTNMIPDGSHVFYVKARDKEGNEVTWTKTIIIMNATAVKPFGTIDAPAMGGIASGSSYRIQGWALAPLLKCIWWDGIDVYVDGVNLGKATYCIYRADIPLLFPGYCNSSGALAYYDLNTMGYNNGVHTVHFVAKDIDAPPNTDGIGSRYFNIWNLGTINARPQTSIHKKRSIHEITEIFTDHSQPVEIRKGYNPNTKPETVYTDEKGNIKIEIKELERTEICLSDQVDNSTYTGYQVVGRQLWPLPIGSTLDSQKGIFYWSPGPGFIGNYQLVFLKKDLYGEITKTRIDVKIVPKF